MFYIVNDVILRISLIIVAKKKTLVMKITILIERLRHLKTVVIKGSK